jgi:hypothetical protein
MKLISVAATAVIAMGVVGLVEARGGGLFSPPSAEQALSTASEKLALTPNQQAHLLPLLKRGLALRAQIREEAEATLQADREELARPDADLSAMSAEHQARIDARLKEARALRDDLLTFYNRELSPDQQARARVALIKRIDRLDRIRNSLLSLRDDTGFGP